MTLSVTVRRAPDSRSPLRSNREFVRLWAGETVSLFGSEVTFIALPLLAVLTLRVSAVQLGMLNAAKFAPFLLLALPAGAWLDRRTRRPVLIAANAASALALLSVPILSALHLLQIELLITLAFLCGIFAVFLNVAFWSYMPAIVEGDQLMDANSKLYASTSAASAGGPGLGGLLVQALSPAGALLFDAGSFLVVTAALWSIRRPEPAVVHDGPRRLRAEVAVGLRFVFGNPYLRAFAGEAAMFNVFQQAMMTAFLLYAVRDLEMGPGLLGVVIASCAVGTFAGSLAARRVQRRFALGPAVVAAMFLGTWPFLLVPLATQPGWRSVGVLTTGYLAAGVGIGVVVVLVSTLRQSITPPQMMGRMNASYRFVVWGCIAIGAVLGGVLGTTLGLHATLVIGALGVALAPAWIVWSPIRHLRTVEDALALPATLTFDANGTDGALGEASACA